MLYIWLILIVLGFCKKNSKVITSLQMAFAILLITFNDNNPDYNNNYLLFKRIISGEEDIISGNIIYKCVFRIFGIFGNYHIVVFAISMIAIILVYKTIIFYTDKCSFCFSLYLIASFVIDATQLKNFLAMAIWLYFSRYLYKAYINDNRKKNIMIYIIGVVISSLCHVSFVITLFYLVVLILDTKVLVIISSVICVLGVTSLVFLSSIINNISNWIIKKNIFFMKFIESKIFDYSLVTTQGGINTRIILEVLFFLIWAFCWGIVNVVYIHRYCSKTSKLLYFVMNLNIVIIIMLPLLIISVEIYRFQRNLLILNYAAISTCLRCNRESKLKINVFNFIILLCSCCVAFFYLYVDAILWNYENVFMNLFMLY